MEALFFNEPQLACHWGVSPKTQQGWRMDGRGPVIPPKNHGV